MKKLVLPLMLAMIGGIASASAATIVSAKKSATAYAAYVADSAEKHVKDSTAAADSLAKEHKAHAAQEVASEGPMTPADSIREAQNLPTTLKTATKDLPNAAEPKHGAASASAHASAPATEHAATPAGHDASPAIKNAAAPVARTITPRSVDAPKTPVKAAPAAADNGLPENRIAKIFSAMQPKEAAKVLEQMSDSDVRVILSQMGDKQAAAVLVAFPAARAASISKGESARPAETHKPEVKPEAAKADSSKTKKETGGEHK